MVVSLFISPAPGEPVQSVGEAEAVAGRGLIGDRYEQGTGTFSTWPHDHELTFVESEAAQAAAIETEALRRNVVTEGVRLNELVGKRFRVGASVVCEGTRLCEPCAHLERVANRAGLAETLRHKGGLRAIILTGGSIRVGDTLTVEGK